MATKKISLEGARKFKAIIFSHPCLSSAEDFIQTISSITVKNSFNYYKQFPNEQDANLPQNKIPDRSIIQIFRFKIKCNEQLFRSQEPGNDNFDPFEKYRSPNSDEFHYPVYLGVYSPSLSLTSKDIPLHKRINSKVLLLAVPFVTLIKTIQKSIHLKGERITFHKYDLQKIFSDLFHDNKDYSAFSLTSFKCDPIAEPLINKCTVSLREPKKNIQKNGSEKATIGNLVKTDLFKNLYEKGINIDSCRIKYDDLKKHRFSVESDKHGNLSFHLRKEGENITLMYFFFSLFLKNGWIDSTTLNPLKRNFDRAKETTA